MRVFFILVFLAVLVSPKAFAFDLFDPEFASIQLGGVTYHMPRNKKMPSGNKFNGENFGLGVGIHYKRELSAAVGYYQNSVEERSHYALAQFNPVDLPGGFNFGFTGGFVDGYPEARKGHPVFVTLFSMSRSWKHWGINMFAMPAMENSVGVIGLTFYVKQTFLEF